MVAGRPKPRPDANTEGYAGAAGRRTSMNVGSGKDELASGELSTEDWDDSDALRRKGVRGAREREAKGEKGEIAWWEGRAWLSAMVRGACEEGTVTDL